MWGFSDSSVGKESTCNAGEPSLIPGSGRSPAEGIGYPLWYSFFFSFISWRLIALQYCSVFFSYIDVNQPWTYLYSPSRSPLPPPSPPNSSGSSQCTRPEHLSHASSLVWWSVLVFLSFPCDSIAKESTCNAGDLGSIPGLERSPREGKGYLLQYSGLDNGVTNSWTRLSGFHVTSPTMHKDSHFSTSSPMLAILISFKFFYWSIIDI